MSVDWLLRQAPRPQAKVRLFCFPYAGVGASVYRLWAAGLPPEVEVCALQLPGRESRLRETPLPTIAAMVDALAHALTAHLDKPFAFFGHSMGAIIAAELARELPARGLPGPAHLFVSGRRPPGMPGTESPLHELGDEDFVAAIVRRYGGIPAEVLRDREVMALLLPCLRADIKALELHRPAQRSPLQIPVTVFGGAEDRLAPLEHLDAWRDETGAGLRVRVFPGDHFYLNPQRTALLAELTAVLAALVAKSATPRDSREIA
ncbi:MAG: alpha/beta fold hydrolase [Pseudomonadota bacterium]